MKELNNGKDLTNIKFKPQKDNIFLEDYLLLLGDI